MSVAFRRESDDEHKEPVFELPIPPGPNLVTARGLGLIEERVAALEAAVGEDRPEEERAPLRRDLRYWRQRLATAQLTPPPQGDEIAFGHTVRLRLNAIERTVRIVGEDEAEPAAGLIAPSSPLARALLGAGEGDLLPFAGRDDAIEVLGVG